MITKNLKLLLPIISASVLVKSTLEFEVIDDVLQSFTISLNADDGKVGANVYFTGKRNLADVDLSTVELQHSSTFNTDKLLKPNTPFDVTKAITLISGVKINAGDILSSPIEQAFLGTLMTLHNMPNVDHESIALFKLMQKLTALFTLGINYQNPFGYDLDNLISNFNAIIEPLELNFKDKSILQ